VNFLAHLFLSGNDEHIMVGNFIADMVKGRQIEKFEDKILRGILIHRAIDAYTDSHPIVELSKARLRSRYRKYAGVLIDMYYDHYLAAYWNNYSDVSLDAFIHHSYRVIIRNYVILPPRAKRILPSMVAANWLKSYASLEDMKKILAQMANRTTFESGMEHAVAELQLYYPQFKEEFEAFFPDLENFVKTQFF